MMWQVVLLYSLATVGAGVTGIGLAVVLCGLYERAKMGPSKIAKNSLSCDGCGHLIAKGGEYRIDKSGYLLCPACAELGDLTMKAV